MQPSEETASTSSNAGCPTLSMAWRTSAIGLITPVEVSLCTTQTALTARAVSAVSFCATTPGSTPCRQSPGTKSTTSPSLVAICCHNVAKCPVSKANTVSPGLSVFTSAASQPPVPEPG